MAANTDPSSDRAPAGTVELDYLGRDLAYLSRVLRASLRVENAIAFKDMSLIQGDIAIINLIGINPGISQNELAAAVVLKKSAVTKIIKSLEERGLIERRKVNADKRYNALALTPAGEEKRDRLRAVMERQQTEIMAPLSPEEQSAFLDQLNRLCLHLIERSRSRADGAAGFDDGD